MKSTTFIKLILLCSWPMVFLSSCQKNEHHAKEGTVITTVEEFKNALSSGDKAILVSDLDFNHESITINHDVKIDSLNKEAYFKNVYFNLSGPKVTDERIDVSFNNLIFDDSFDASNIDLEIETSFVDKFSSEREENRCINANEGYFSLSLDNCTIKNYASSNGPAIFVENYDLDDNKYVFLNDCKIYHNYSEWDTIHLSHNKLVTTVTNSEFYGNYAYKGAGFSIANGSAVVDRVNVHDNIFVPYDVDQNNFQLAGGGIFFGGTDITMTDSFIVNNKTIYGGGLAIATPYSGNKNIIFKNVVIKNNEATYGGGIVAFSLAGQPITFVDSEILCNKATLGSSLYTEVYAKWIKERNGGLLQFFFTTFGLNTAEDNNGYSFYQEENTKGELGTISLKGCLSIGNDTYESKSDDYNYIATKEQALLDGVIEQRDIDNASDGLYPKKSSKADIKVSNDIYSKWSEHLKDFEGDLKVGKNAEKTTKTLSFTVILAISIPSLIIIALVVVIIILVRNKKNKKEVLSPKDEKERRAEYLKTLSPREKQVVEMLIAGKKRKDIATELNYSENTIKKDLTLIYSKLHVLDKYELIVKYQDLL